MDLGYGNASPRTHHQSGPYDGPGGSETMGENRGQARGLDLLCASSLTRCIHRRGLLLRVKQQQITAVFIVEHPVLAQ